MISLFDSLTPNEFVVLQFPEIDGPEVVEPEPVQEAAVVDTAREAELVVQGEAAMREQMEMACERAADDARKEAEARFRDALETERSAVTVACTSFARARDKYFASIEAEVVKLSLAIAARVLQREVNMDPMLLLGVVHVALARLSDTDGAVLCTPPDQVELWRRAMRSNGVRVEADTKMHPGELQLRAPMGVAELGIAAQLQEIERGFFDLLAKRPA